MYKTIGCKISVDLYNKINDELNKIGITKSEFIRMLIDIYFQEHRLDEESKVNRLTSSVNQFSEGDRYNTTKREVDEFLKI